MASPSNHRDLSQRERQRMSELQDAAEHALHQLVGTPSSTTEEGKMSSGCWASLADTVREISESIESDLSQCNAIVKSTRICLILRRCLEATRKARSEGSVSGTVSPLWEALDRASLRAYRLLVEYAHSRRSFHGLFPAHGELIVSLLRQEDLQIDGYALLLYVASYAQDAREIVDALLGAGLLTVLREAVQSMAQLRSATSTTELQMVVLVRLIRAVATTLQGSPSSLLALANITFELGSSIAALHLHSGSPLQQAGEIASELSRLFGLFALERIPIQNGGNWLLTQFCAPLVPQVLWMYVEGCSSETDCTQQHLSSSSSSSSTFNPQNEENENCFAPLCRVLQSHLNTIRRQNLDSATVQRCLLSMHRLLQSTDVLRSAQCAFVLSLLPGSLKTLSGTLSTVDEHTSSLTCAVLTAMIARLHWHPLDGTRSSESDSVASVVQQLIDLDVVFLLADMLEDYSVDVLVGAFGLLRELVQLPAAVQCMSRCGVFPRVRRHCHQLSTQFLTLSDEEDGAALVALTVLCVDVLCRFPREWLETSFSDPAETAILLQTFLRARPHDPSVEVVRLPALRLCARLLEIHPLVAWSVIQTVAWDQLPHTALREQCQFVVTQAVASHAAVLPTACVEWIDAQLRLLVQDSSSSSLEVKRRSFWSVVVIGSSQRTDLSLLLQQTFEPLLVHELQSQARTNQAAVSDIFQLVAIWGLMRTRSEVYNSVAQICVGEDTEDQARCACVELLCAEVDSSHPLRSSMPILMTRTIVLCESFHDASDAHIVANSCFEWMVAAAVESALALHNLGTVALTAPPGFVTPLGWFGTIEDSDDAHDVLVAVAPLLNGILHRSAEARNEVDCALFLRLLEGRLSGDVELEVPLRVIGAYGLWHLLQADRRDIIEHLLRERSVVAMTALLQQSAQLAPELHENTMQSLFQLAECFLLALRAAPQIADLHPPDAVQFEQDFFLFVETTALHQIPHSEAACVLLLTAFQEDSFRRKVHQLPSERRDRYQITLMTLQDVLASATEGSPSYYMQLQVIKYLDELRM